MVVCMVFQVYKPISDNINRRIRYYNYIPTFHLILIWSFLHYHDNMVPTWDCVCVSSLVLGVYHGDYARLSNCFSFSTSSHCSWIICLTLVQEMQLLENNYNLQKVIYLRIISPAFLFKFWKNAGIHTISYENSSFNSLYVICYWVLKPTNEFLNLWWFSVIIYTKTLKGCQWYVSLCYKFNGLDFFFLRNVSLISRWQI